MNTIEATLTAAQEAEVNRIADQGRNVVIGAIRKSLKARSGKAWSVTGGRGTAWGWIEIDATPARKTLHCELKAGALGRNPDDYEYVNTGVVGGYMTLEDRAELAKLLGKETIHMQGEKIPASTNYYRVALAQAMFGNAGTFTAEPYWD